MIARSISLALLTLGMSSPALASDDGQSERQMALETAFAEMLTGAELVGHFAVDGRDEGEPLSEDRYTISKVTKLAGDVWRFDCRVRYGERDVTVPIPLAVKWAGDTPVITLTDLNIPGLGTYTARVLLHRDRYAGTWMAGDHGGTMFGRIERAGAADGDGAGAAAGGAQAGNDVPRWPSFRGVRASGVADGPAPTTWSVETGEHVAWTTPVPGLGHSSPVVWGDRLFVTTAVGERGGDAELKVGLYGDIQPVEEDFPHRFDVICLDRHDGRVLWTRTAHEGVPKVKRHPKASHASSSVATDGTHVVAFFGSEGLYCYDMEGNLEWSKDFGLLDSGFFMLPGAQWGFASSPIIHDGLVIVQCDVQQDSFLAAFAVEEGREVWRTPREEVPTWSTPTVIVGDDGRAQVVVNGWKHIGGYDLATGAELWKLEGGGDIPVPTPVVGEGLIFITNAHGRMAPVYAIDPKATGDLGTGADTAFIAWSIPRRGNYMQTPLVHGEHLYTCTDNGILGCYVAKTGEQVYRERIGQGTSGFTPSIVAAGDHLYVTSEAGEVHVVKLGPEFGVVTVNDMGETCMATPAIVDGTIYVRTRGHLVAIR